MRRLIFFLFFIFSIYLGGQNLNWAFTLGNASADIGWSVVTDANGNVYTTGYFTNTIDFDPGPGLFSQTSNGNCDIFVMKNDPLGNLIWVRTLGSINADIPR